MPHFTEGELQAYLDAEVSAPAREEIVAHLDTCPVCEAELQALRGAAGLFAYAIQLADGPTPAFSPAGLRVHPRTQAVWQLAGFSRRALARAAVLIISVAAAASAAVPGMPLRRWVESVWPQIGTEAPTHGSKPAIPAVVEQAAPELAPGFAAIQPVDGQALVRLIDAASGMRIRVLLVDSSKVTVTANGAASNAQLGTATGRLDVTGAGPGEVVIQLPRMANATVQVNGATYVLKVGDAVEFPGPQPDESGDQILFLIR